MNGKLDLRVLCCVIPKIKELLSHIKRGSILITRNGCWTRNNFSDNYSRVGPDKIGIHRISASLFLNHIINGPFLACHTCDNKPCFNPIHLFEGTYEDNANDSVLKNRHRWAKNPTSKVDTKDFVEWLNFNGTS